MQTVRQWPLGAKLALVAAPFLLVAICSMSPVTLVVVATISRMAPVRAAPISASTGSGMPEPGTALLMGLGLAGLAAIRRATQQHNEGLALLQALSGAPILTPPITAITDLE